jgi:glycosyltransferase involved in cell wall biosynthesis
MEIIKIAIDSSPLTSGHAVRGIGVNTRELLQGFKLVPHKDIQIAEVDFSKDNLSKYDIVHYQYFRPYFVDMPFTKPAKKVVLTIHDLIPLIYPEHYPSGTRGGLNWQINKYLVKKNVDAIITISETSKKDICRFVGIDPKKVFVTYLAARPMFHKLKVSKKWCDSWLMEIDGRRVPKRYALYIGDVNYNKNIPNLVKACEIAKIPLVIAGKQVYQIEKMDLDHPELSHLKNINWSNVIRLGFVPDEILVELMNFATVYIQPSLYEGFGLPALEAIASGTPMAVVKSQCMVEILGNDFSYCDPTDAKSMAKTILNPNRNKKLPRDYSWEKTARETLEVYQRV